jgi:hypothetical protein
MPRRARTGDVLRHSHWQARRCVARLTLGELLRIDVKLESCAGAALAVRARPSGIAKRAACAAGSCTFGKQ